MKYTAIRGAVITTLLWTLSCKEEPAKLPTIPVNEVTIGFDKASYEVDYLAEITINPTLKIQLDAADTFSYEWKIIAENSEDIIGREAILKDTIRTKPGNYTLVFTVTNKKTQVRNYKKTPIVVRGAVYNGYYVTSNKEGKGTVSFLRTDGILYHALEKTFARKAYETEVLRVSTAIVKNLRVVFVATKDNVYRYHADDFELQADKNVIFTEPLTPQGDFMHSMNFVKGTTSNYPLDIFFINGGKLYANTGPNFVPSAISYSVAIAADQPYELFPLVLTNRNFSSIVYDNKTRKFLSLPYNTREFSPLINHIANVFDVTNVGLTAYAADYAENGDGWFFMKSDKNEHFLVKIAQFVAAIGKGKQALSLADYPELERACSFSARADKALLYYAVDNKIYLFDPNRGRATLVYTFSAGSKIVKLRVHKSKFWEPIQLPEYNKKIIVAVNEGSAGSIYQLDLKDDGGIDSRNILHHTGFGKITDIDYRNPNN